MLLAYASGGCFLYSIQRDLLYPGQYAEVPQAPLHAGGVIAHRLRTSSGDVDAWYLPPLTDDALFPVVIFGHGNGEVIDMWADGLDELRRWGMAVMLVEYPGYGRSDGIPSEQGIREAMVAAYDRLRMHPGVDETRMVGYGQSLGGGAVCALARDRPLAALVLQSTFTSIRAFAHRFFLPEFLVLDPFDNAEVLSHFDGPVLLLHGEVDDLIPLEQAKAMAQLARNAELRIYQCGHGCWLPDDLPLYDDMRSFFRRHGILHQ